MSHQVGNIIILSEHDGALGVESDCISGGIPGVFQMCVCVCISLPNLVGHMFVEVRHMLYTHKYDLL